MCDAIPGQVVLGCLKRKADGAEEMMAQWLKGLAVPEEALSSVPSTHMAPFCSSSSRDLAPSLACVENRHKHDVQIPNI